MQIKNLLKVSTLFSLTMLVLSAHAEKEAGKDSTTSVSSTEKTTSTPLMPSSLKTHNIGAAVGFISGYGLTYRHWFPSLNGYQVTFVPVGRLNDNETFFNSSIGAIGLRSLHRTESTNFFGYYGAHYNFTYNETTNFNYASSSDPAKAPVAYTDNSTENFLFAGGGIGMEIHFWNINYSLMFGYTGNFNTSQFVSDNLQYTRIDNGKWKKSLEFQPSIETALFYCF